MGAAPLSDRFAAHVREADLLRSGQRVLIALSGGLDSVCLLHLLRFTSRPLGLTLHAAHFDHALRPASARDAEWVRGLCRAWDVPLEVARTPVPPRGEAAARTQRYAFLHRAARELGADVILTAHQADDQLETLLFRLARGTGLGGLRGIPMRRGLLVRPLLPFRRAELAGYAGQVGLGWREDETNAWPGLSRNRIRHTVLPALEAAWPDAARRLAELAATATALEALWQWLLPGLIESAVERAAAGRFELARVVLQEYHRQTRARVMRHLAQQLGSPLDRAGTRAALDFVSHGESGTGIRLGANLQFEREFEQLLLSRSVPAAPDAGDLPVRIETERAGSARARIGGAWFDVSWGPRLDPGTATRLSASFDPSALRFPLELRGWRPGDRIRLGSGSKKLKKLFGERRVARSRRACIPVLAEQGGAGGVLWIAGVACATDAQGGNDGWYITVSNGESG